MSYTKTKDQYRLTIREINSLIIFKNKIGFVHPKKQEVLNLINSQVPRVRTL